MVSSIASKHNDYISTLLNGCKYVEVTLEIEFRICNLFAHT